MFQSAGINHPRFLGFEAQLAVEGEVDAHERLVETVVDIEDILSGHPDMMAPESDRHSPVALAFNWRLL